MRSANTYQDICERLVQEIRGKVPNDIYTDVEDVMCSEGKDFERVLSGITDKLGISEISRLVSHTFIKIYLTVCQSILYVLLFFLSTHLCVCNSISVFESVSLPPSQIPFFFPSLYLSFPLYV